MSSGQVIRLIIGIIVTCVVAFAGFLWLNHSLANIYSERADLKLDTYTVSIDYSGIVASQDVEVGQTVKKGDKLLEIRSIQLTEALNTSRIKSEDLQFTVNDSSGNIEVKAVDDGTVQQINFRIGSYIPASAPIATIGVSNSFYVSAIYKLNAPDYARIDRSRPIDITLPDNTTMKADIFDISQQRNDDIIETVIKARLNDGAAINQEVFSDGTPVTALLKLNSSRWYQTLTSTVKELLLPGEVSN